MKEEHAGDEPEDSKLDIILAELSAVSNKVDTVNTNLSGKIDNVSNEVVDVSNKVEAINTNLSGQIDSVSNEIVDVSNKLVEQAEIVRRQFAAVLEDTGIIKQEFIKKLTDMGISIDVIIKAMDNMGRATVIFEDDSVHRELKISEVIALVKSRFHDEVRV